MASGDSKFSAKVGISDSEITQTLVSLELKPNFSYSYDEFKSYMV